MRRCEAALAAAFAAALGLSQPAAAAPSTAAMEVVAAERAFAADVQANGIQAGFLKHAAPEGIVFAPEPVLARALYAAPKPKGAPLVWWPLWAGVSRSEDLGFTTGPFTYDGRPGGWYFTVWARQPDGAWRWLFDGGPPSDAAGAAPDGSPVAYARPAQRRAGSSERGMRQVSAADAALNAAAAKDAPAAFLAVLADDGRIVGSRSAPPRDRAEAARELATRASRISYAPLGGQASRAGDLAWTYGVARWAAPDGADARGHYVRIWRNDAKGWRLLFDELLPAPELKRPPAASTPAAPSNAPTS